MPTYSFRCSSCGAIKDIFVSIGEYCRNPPAPVCCEVMQRFFDVESVPALSNASFGDRYYDGLRATDGTDISSRTKHREYMRRNGLTTVDDFRGEFRKRQKEREEFRRGESKDPELRQTIEEQTYRRL